MATICQITSSAILPSGELAEWTHWIDAPDITNASLYGNAYQASLAGSTAWKAMFTSGTVFNPLHYSFVDEATGTVLFTNDGTTGYIGTNGGSALPPQCSMVVTLRTTSAGARYRGRYYLPAMAVGQETVTGRWSTASVTAALTALVAAHSAGIAAALTANVVIYSRTYRTTSVVLTLSIGDVIDTQRRRRDKLVEARQNASI